MFSKATSYLKKHRSFFATIAILLLVSACEGTNFFTQAQPIDARVSSVISTRQLQFLSMQQAIAEVESKVKINLAPATTAPIRAPSSITLSAPLAPHQIFGFAPYWTLPMEAGFAYKDLTTLAYFSLDVNTNGTINTWANNSGWNGYNSQDLVNLIDSAHQNGARVVLTITCFGTSNISALVSDPTSINTLAPQLISYIEEKNFDGLNIDFEGQGSSIRQELTNFIATLSARLKQVNPNWQITVDTYGTSAQDPFGPFDVAQLNKYVDGFFVMAYDMDNPNVPSPTAPLSNVSPSDAEALASYSEVIPSSKIILGLPYYGYDWKTDSNSLGAQALGQPTPVSYSQILSQDYQQYWDVLTSTPWTAYQEGSNWHEIFFDNPASIELKVALATSFNIAGVGIWALGMDGNSPAMLQALLGDSSVVKIPPLTGPEQNSQNPTPSSPSLISLPPNTYTPTTIKPDRSNALSPTTVPTTTLGSISLNNLNLSNIQDIWPETSSSPTSSTVGQPSTSSTAATSTTVPTSSSTTSVASKGG